MSKINMTTIFLFFVGLSFVLGAPAISNAQNYDGSGTAPQFGSSSTVKDNQVVNPSNRINGNKDMSPKNKDLTPENPPVDPQVKSNRFLEKDHNDGAGLPIRRGNDEVSQIKGKLGEGVISEVQVN